MADDLRASDQSRAGVGFVFGVLDATAVPGPIVVQVLSRLGLSEPTVRQQLARMLRQGHLERERVGRVSVYRMTGGYLERWLRLRNGDRPSVWTGAYEVVVHDIPERHRRRRELLVAAATRAGWASARPGVLIGVRPPDFVDVREDGAEGFVEVGRWQLELPAARRLAHTAWRLPERADDLRAAAAELEQLLRSDEADPPRGVDALGRLWTGLDIAGAVRFAAPVLPSELLPEPWPGDQLQELFGAAVHRFREPAGQYLYEMLTDSAYASLIQGGWWPAIATDHPTGH